MTLFTKKNGKCYYAKFYYTDHSGQLKQKSINTHVSKYGSKKEAKVAAEDLIKEFLRKQQLENLMGLSTHTSHSEDYLADYIKYWLSQLEGSVRDNTLESYRDICNSHIIPLLGNYKLKDIDQFVLAAFIEKELEICQERQDYADKLVASNSDEKLKNTERPFWSSISKHVSHIKMILEYAYNDNEIPDNPAKKINKQILKKIPKSTFKAQPYTKKEIELLKSLIKGQVIEIPVIIAAYTGLRRSEILGLKWSDIDFDNRLLYIRNTCVLVDNKPVYRDDEVKTDGSYDILPIADTLSQYLINLKQQQAHERNFCGEGYYDSDYICRWPDGHLIKPNYVSQTFNSILKKNNLRSTRFHDLRHTVGTTILEATGDIELASKVLRHSDSRTTSRIYVQPTTEYKKRGIDSLE